ncbi:signal recognition particle receptor subunit alpha-like isoform X2 [Mya arenaria]|uniref:signal recognition particle receptor subunit alpha-like isoform X2 n=1 Tax=Mya arenaria TaxID=6604 RepID=UPI0022E10368|nr:signal recognition particle receptor subunit alpha-like isoform X2 [Mya arenaria]
MLDFFTIFSKGGIVLWYFQGTSQLFTAPVNSLIRSVILQERSGSNQFTHEALTLKYKLDNEFELVFVVAYQKILQLSYVDKFLDTIQLEFRNKYKDDLQNGAISGSFDFRADFDRILFDIEQETRKQTQKGRVMKTFEESDKSRKTVKSMIENKKEDNNKKPAKGKENKPVKAPVQSSPKPAPTVPMATSNLSNGELDEETIRQNLVKKFGAKKKTPKAEPKSPDSGKKKGKVGTKWEMGGTSKDLETLDFNKGTGDNMNGQVNVKDEELQQVGTMGGELKNIETDSESEEEEEEEVTQTASTKKSGGGKGMFGMFKNLVGSKMLSHEDLQPVLEKMKEHLVSKNVASDIAQKLCDSVAVKLEGKTLGTFSSISTTVKTALNESCLQILRPRRRVDILRDAMEAKQNRRPYCITFCGVNGVGKSTNLAKICFWLVENGFRVMIAACDTFRAGAVEQLRTHTRKLNALHPPEKHAGQQMVQLYEKGYGKDAAGIAMEAINFARDCHIDVVLVDTAGRMQDNEPLMRALAKLIKVNQPDLVLFVGEALVGNEAVDQLTKFNQALADHSNMTNPRLIDGIILSKFDTIDDKVGAAISMTYTTGQPIVFVGTGQTYTDLRNLNAKAVVHALLK